MSVTTTQLTTADTSGFIPQAWCKTALDVLRSNIVLAGKIRKDTDMGEAGWQGKTLNIPYPGTFTAQDKAANTVSNIQAAVGGATVSLTLSKFKTVDFLIEDYAAAQANQDLMQRYVQPAIVAMAEQLESDLITMYTGLTGTPQGIQGGHSGSVTYADILKMRQSFNDLKIPQSERFIFMSDKDEVGILQDTTIATYFAYAQAQALATGKPPQLGGFDIYQSQLVPTALDGGTHGIQSFTVSGSPTGGTFTLTYGGQTTAGIPIGAAAGSTAAQNAVSAAQVTAALRALSSIPAGTPVSCSYAPTATGGVYTISIWPAAGSTTALTYSVGGLTGGSAAGAVADVSGHAATTFNLALHPDSMLMANRPFADIPPDSGVKVAQMQDPMSGLSMRVLYQYSMDYRGVRVAFDMLYGFTVLRPTFGAYLQA